jgi:hypothetical protein
VEGEVHRSVSTARRISRCLAIGAICFAVLGLFSLVRAAHAAAAVPKDYYGVNAQLLLAWSQDRWSPHLDAIRASGIGVVRKDADWGYAEPLAPDPVTGAHKYRWQAFDDRVAALSRGGLRWYPILDYSAPWAAQVSGDVMTPPRDPRQYAAYAAAFATRYGRGGDFWREHPELPALPVTSYEIWNEPNVEYFWHPQAAAPEDYADLYMAARQAIHAVDPEADVVVGGLSVIGIGDFLRRMFASRPDLAGNIDAVGFHPYGSNISTAYSRIRTARLALDAVGAHAVPMEISETGLAVAPAPESTRAEILRRLAEDLPRSDCGVRRLIPHTWVTSESDPTENEDWFGIANHDATLKPSAVAYKKAVLAMTGVEGVAPSGSVSLCYAPATPAPTALRRGLTVKLVGAKLRARRGLRLRAVCSTGCRLTIEVLSTRRAAGGRTRLLRTRARSLRRLHRLRVARASRVRRWRGRTGLVLHVVATDAAGNAVNRTVRLRRPNAPRRG